MSDMTIEEKQRYVLALIEERQSAARSQKKSRVKDIDAELERVGYKAAAPIKRAETRERKRPSPPEERD